MRACLPSVFSMYEQTYERIICQSNKRPKVIAWAIIKSNNHNANC